MRTRSWLQLYHYLFDSVIKIVSVSHLKIGSAHGCTESILQKLRYLNSKGAIVFEILRSLKCTNQIYDIPTIHHFRSKHSIQESLTNNPSKRRYSDNITNPKSASCWEFDSVSFGGNYLEKNSSIALLNGALSRRKIMLWGEVGLSKRSHFLSHIILSPYGPFPEGCVSHIRILKSAFGVKFSSERNGGGFVFVAPLNNCLVRPLAVHPGWRRITVIMARSLKNESKVKFPPKRLSHAVLSRPRPPGTP